jgi:gluconokinase
VAWASQVLNLESSSSVSYDAVLSEVEELADDDLAAAEEPSPYHESRRPTSITFVPFLSGERSPGFRDAATGCLFGLTLASRPAHVLKACLEGVTLRFNSIVSLLLPKIIQYGAAGADAIKPEDARLVISGKALEANSLWRQMVADCTGMPVVFDEDADESTSRGVATMVAMVLESRVQEKANIETLPLERLNPLRVSQPRSAMASHWKRLSADQERLLQALTPLYAKPRTYN